MSDAHSHTHAPLETSHAKQSLYVALAVSVTLTVIEVVGGWVFHSLALSADAAHMFSDVVAFAVAITAQHLAVRPASAKHSFGWRRTEVLAAQLNGILLLGVAAWIVVEAVQRFDSPQSVESTGLIVVAAIGLVGNLFVVGLLNRGSGDNINLRAAGLHAVGDALGSLGALIAGVLIAAWGFKWADPTASVLTSALVVFAGVKLVRDTTRVLMEATPSGFDVEGLERAIAADHAVLAVHHLHVWSLAPGELALSAHVALGEEITLHAAQAEGDRLKKMLAESFGIGHATLELECHPCHDDDSV